MNYAEILKHPFWQKKRLEIFQRDNWTCLKCTDQTTNLQVHHLYYLSGHMPWEYPDEAFVTLCDLCHQKEEFLKYLRRIGVKLLVRDGLPADEITNLIQRRLAANFHRESAIQYMDDIKTILEI